MLEQQIKVPLLLLRLGVFIVMALWVVDKFVNPAHTAGVWSTFYFIDSLPASGSYVAGVVQGALVLGFVLGMFKTISYGGVLIMHFISTVTPFDRYLDPYTLPNALFFAAWPMLAACIALFMLREYDTLLTAGNKGSG